jgi:hypothetical protein
MKISIIIPIVSLLFILNIQAHEVVQVDEFNAIKAARNVQIELVKSDTMSVNIKDLNGFEREDVEINTEGKLLNIKTSLDLFSDEKVKIQVTFKELNNVEAIAGAKVLTEDTLKGSHIELKAASGSILSLNIKADSITSTAISGGLISVDGLVKGQYVKANSGSTFSGFDLISQNAVVEAHTKGKAKINVQKYVKATAKTGGFINIKGNPEKEYITASFGGEVIKNENIEK